MAPALLGAGDPASPGTGSLVDVAADLAGHGRQLLWSQVSGDVTSWGQLMDGVGSSPIGPQIKASRVPTSGPALTIPPGDWDLRHGGFSSAWVGADGSEISVAPGAHLRNVGQLIGTQLAFGQGATFAIDGAPGQVRVVIMAFGGGMRNDGSTPPIVVPPGEFYILGSILGGGIQAGASPLIRLGVGSFMAVFGIDSTTGNPLAPNCVTSVDASAILLNGHTGGFTGFVPQAGFLGTQINAPFTLNAGSGPTSARPLVPSPFGLVAPGTFYYDTTLNEQIHLNNALVWVDNAGAPV